MQTHGGISRCFAELYQHMPSDVEACIAVKKTNNVYLQAMGFPSAQEDYDNFIHKGAFPMKRILYKAVRNIQAGHPERWDRWPRINLYLTEDYLKNKLVDVLHPTYYDDYFLKLIGDMPFVITVHDMIPELYPQYYNADEYQIRKKRIVIPRASHIVTVSEQTKKDLMRIMHIPEEQITVVYHGADTTPYSPAARSPFDFEYLLYIGERHMYKNFMSWYRDCLPLLRRHRDLKIVCTGKPFTNIEQSIFDSFGTADRLVHVFVETNQELLDIYHHALAFAYPSSYEGFGIPIIEAYKADCPVMLNHASCFPEIAGDAAIFFRMEECSSDFEEQFEILYHMNSIEREHLLDKQRERLKLYSWEKSANTLAQIYKKVC